MINLFQNTEDSSLSFEQLELKRFQNIISDVTDRWVSEASNINTPRFINNVLYYSYYFVSDTLQQKIKAFILSRFTVEPIDSLIRTCYLFSINKTFVFSTEIQISILDSINKMILQESDNLPYGYFKEDIKKYHSELSILFSKTS